MSKKPLKNHCIIKACLVFIACIISVSLLAQKGTLPLRHTTRPARAVDAGHCGFDEVRQPRKLDNLFIEAEARMNRTIHNLPQQRPDTTPAVLTLPVVFHIVSANPAGVADIQIYNQLQNLNDAFSKSGIYSTSTGVNTYIQFCFAKTDPDGGLTNGITRTTYFFGTHLNPLIEDAKIKSLVNWDPVHYINIWLIDTMDLEIYPRFECNKWIRANSLGYATLPPTGPLDGIVLSDPDALIAIEQMGHYLGLYHTFDGGCKNNDCTTDGDMVCDTPPDASLGNSPSCTSPTNSCNTDTLSGFSVDMPDLIANFMDNGNIACRNQFTAGQAVRMRNAIMTQRAGLLVNKCNSPCNINVVASFTQSITEPVVGNTVVFTNTSTGATSYQWLVDNVPAATTANFSKTFGAAGNYKITLKAYNGSTCFAITFQNVIVNCGVTARFYTDKRQIASRVPSYPDSIHFINTSENGLSYQWLMKNDIGMVEQVISTSTNFTYTFPLPGNYEVRLIAANGSCKDTTESYPIPVTDPDPNGYIVFSKAECYMETKVRISFYVCNYGYMIIPKNIPITFYDTNPALITANKLGTTFYLPDSIFGKCCSPLYTAIVDVGHRGLNSFYIVFNDNGTTRPLSLPNTTLLEPDYNNNIARFNNFAFRVTATPPLPVLEWHDTLQLKAVARPDTVISYIWSTPANLSCSSCQSPLLVATTSTTKTVTAYSKQGCTDTATIAIQVPPYNDFTVHINDLQCAVRDSFYINFTIFNSFKRPLLPKKLSVSFYSGDPSVAGAILLSPVFSLPDTLFAKQATYGIFIKAPAVTGKIYAVVNDSGMAAPVTFTNAFHLEKDYTNNIDDTTYFTDTVLVQPADTTVLRKSTFPLTILTPIYNAATTLWTAGNTYTLSCTACPSPVVQVFDNSIVPVQTANRYGCIIHGASRIHILPADMTIHITNVKCITNYTVEVTFTICMSNNYDSVFAGIPVSFYDANPDSGVAHLLQPVFYTPNTVAGNCHTYTTTVTTTTTGKIFAVVNDNGNNINTVPNNVFAETSLNNNIDDTAYTPFTVSVIPRDTSIDRLGSIVLIPSASGGTISTYLWSPAQFLSCTTCANPIVLPTYSMQYILTAKNQTNCTDTALVVVRTHTSDGVYIPDAFTPNNDGLNDVLYVLGGKEVNVVKDFMIFNRWGQKIFDVHNVAPNTPVFGWNGKIKGINAEGGTYVYSVTVILANGKEALYKGTVVLIR